LVLFGCFGWFGWPMMLVLGDGRPGLGKAALTESVHVLAPVGTAAQ
jgi:hypothetical protein